MVINNSFVKPIQPQGVVQKQRINQRKVEGSFSDIFSAKERSITSLKFSKHAVQRMEARNINLSSEQKDKISAAVNKASNKGVNDTLVLMDDMAFVINVKNKVVVTAANSTDLKENVFTNIDGAVML